MARRRRKGKAEEAPAEEPTAAEPEASDTPDEAEVADDPTEDATEDSSFDLSFDRAASDATLTACAGLFSTAQTATSEASQAAAPFLSFAQKSRIFALATDFETRRMSSHVVEVGAPAAAAAAPVVQTQDSLTREEIESIISHRLEIAVHDAMAKLGVSPDSTIKNQVERQVEVQLSVQEHRLLEYVKQSLTSSLEVLEGSLDHRIAEYLEGEGEEEEARAEVDAQVEEAREALLKNIDEVRTVETGFDISMLDIAGIAEISDRVSSDTIGAIDDDDIPVEMGDDDDVALEMGDDDELELEALEAELDAELDDELEVEAAPDDEVEVEAAPDVEAEAAPDDEDEASDALAVAMEIAAGLGSETGTEEAEETQIDEDVVSIETSVADVDAVVDLDDDEEEIEIEAAPSGDDAEVELQPVEEISLIEGASEATSDDGETDELVLETADLIEAPDDEATPEEAEAEEAALADALEIELDDEPGEEIGLETLGEGPEDLMVAPVDEPVDLAQIEAAEDEERDEDDLTESTDDDDDAISRYLQRAQEMRGRRQNAAAMELYGKVIDLDASNYEARIGRGVLSLETKDYKRAVEEFTEAEKIDPSRPASALGLAEVHFHRKQFNKAIRHYTQCLKLDDELGQAYCNRGLSYYYQKNYKKAFLDLMRAYDLDPTLPNIKKYLKLVRNKVKTDKSTPGTAAPKKKK